MEDQTYFNVMAGAMIAVVLVVGLGGVLASASSGGGAASEPTSYLNLTIELNTTSGAPQYVPANFSVPAGYVVITLRDEDSPVAWPACTCQVAGTVGGSEILNGTSLSSVPTSNVAHTFTIPSLGINVLSPGNGTITFKLLLTTPGDYSWYCDAPCGSNGYTGFPMGVPGYMTGTMTVN